MRGFRDFLPPTRACDGKSARGEGVLGECQQGSQSSRYWTRRFLRALEECAAQLLVHSSERQPQLTSEPLADGRKLSLASELYYPVSSIYHFQ